MKKYLLVLVTLLVTMFASNSFAYTPPKPDGFVMDVAGKLTSAQKAQLNAKLDHISQTTKNEFAALIVPSMNGESIEDVAQDTFKSWKIGKAGLDNGVLIVIAVSERKSRIQTGKGVEGDLTDLQANDILLKTLNPHLKTGDFYGGLNASFDAISSTIESRGATPTPPPTTTPQTGNGDGIGWVFLGLLGAGGIIALAVFLWRKAEDKRVAKELEEHLEQMRLERVERDRLAQRQRDEQLRLAQVRAEAERKLKEQRNKEIIQRAEEREQALTKDTPFVEVPSVPRVPRPTPKRPPLPTSHTKPTTVIKSAAVVAGVAAAAATMAEEERRRADVRRREEDDSRRRRERDEAEARSRREREEEDRRRRDREEEDRRSSSSSSSLSDLFNSGSGSSGGGFGGFGGGDSGGGGSSSDW